MLPPPPTSSPSLSPGEAVAATGSTVGEAFAIAPDTYVVPGWWSFPGGGLGLPLGTLVVRGQATAVVDTAPAPLEDDWLAAVLALVDPAEVRWIVATAPDAARAGCVAALHALAPRATVVVPGSGCAVIDLGRGRSVHLHEAPPGAGPSIAPAVGPLAVGSAGGSVVAGPMAVGPLTPGPAVGPLTPGPAGGPVVAPAGGSAGAAKGPCPVPGQLVVEVRDRRVLWTDVIGGAFARPVAEVAGLDDEEVVAAIVRRARALQPGEIERTAGLGLRVLGSPIGPVVRGSAIAHALALAARAEAQRSPATLSLDALLAPLGPPPWIAPPEAPPASW